MSFWEALTADNSSLAHTMFARYSTCSFFIWTEMKVCVLVHFTKVAWEVDWHNESGKTNLLFEKLCLFHMTTNTIMYMISSQSMKHISTLNTMKEKHVVRLSPAVSKHFSLWLTFMPCTKFHYEVVFQTFVFVFILILFTCWFLSSTTKSCKILIWLISYIYIGNKSEIIII